MTSTSPQFNSQEIEPYDPHFQLVEESRRRHPELARENPPTVEELLQIAASLHLFYDQDVWEDLADLAEVEPVEPQDIIYFEHRLGDGLHYMNNHAVRLKDGRIRPGDTSEPAVLFNLEMVIIEINLNYTFDDLWNMVYPGQFMSAEDSAYLLGAGLRCTLEFDASAPENVADVLADLRAIGCWRLAELMKGFLRVKGIEVI